MQQAFIRFLETEYHYQNIEPFDSVNNEVNSLFLADTAEGGRVLVKRAAQAELCENEYRKGKALHDICPRHFAEMVAYSTHPQHSFTAQAFLPGKRIVQVLAEPELADEVRAGMVEDLYTIFQALKQSDVVHRDIHAWNILLHDGRLILVDFQIAVSKKDYRELSVFQDELSMAQYRGPHLYSMIGWDDTHSLLLILQKVGSAPSYAARYTEVEREMAEYVGRDTVWYRFSPVWVLRVKCMMLRLRMMFAVKAARRSKFAGRLQGYGRLIKAIRRGKKFPRENDFAELLTQGRGATVK